MAFTGKHDFIVCLASAPHSTHRHAYTCDCEHRIRGIMFNDSEEGMHSTVCDAEQPCTHMQVLAAVAVAPCDCNDLTGCYRTCAASCRSTCAANSRSPLAPAGCARDSMTAVNCRRCCCSSAATCTVSTLAVVEIRFRTVQSAAESQYH
jgi:hypothetical protein